MKNLTRSLGIMLGVLGIFAIASQTAHADAFNQNRIIDDVVFDNTATMSAAQIDTFLNSFSNSCISSNSGFKAIDPTGYNPTQGYSYGGFVTAGQVIYDAAQAYSINPQVLVATLEKEQSLVSGSGNFSGFCNSGSQNKYTAALGYGCPDSGTTYSYTGLSLYQRNGTVISSTGSTCVNTSSKAGFSQQLIRAAWLLKFGEERSEGKTNWAIVKGNWNNSDDPQTCYSGPMTAGTYARCPSGGSSYYDGYTTIDSTSVHMDDGATAALYWYTPHFHGNQLFSSIFTQWFGLPYGTKILKSNSDPAFYLYNSGQKLKIPSYALYLAYGFDKIGVTIVTDDYLNAIPSGNDLTNLARGSDGTVHLISNGKRYIVSSDMCASWGLDCFNPYVVNTIDSDMLNLASYAGYLQPLMSNEGVTYLMSSGKKNPYLNSNAVAQAGYTAAQVTPVEDTNAAQTVGALIPAKNTSFKFNGSSAIVLYTADGQYVTVGDTDTFYAWGLDRLYAANVPVSSTDSSPPSSVATIGLSSRILSVSGKTYLIDQGHRYDLSSDSSDWPSAGTLSYMNSTAAALPTTITTVATCFRTDSGSIFMVRSSQMRPITSYDDAYILGCTGNNLVAISDSSTKLLTTGGNTLPLGKVFKKPNDGGIYIVDSANSSTLVPSYSMFTSLGLVSDDVINISLATSNGYPNDGNAPSYGQKNGVYYIFSPTGVKYLGNKEVLQAWGLTNFNPVYFGVAGSRPKTIQSTLFAHTPSGVIYYASGGSKHVIASYSAYLRLGGTPANTMEVYDDFMSSLPTGNPMS